MKSFAGLAAAMSLVLSHPASAAYVYAGCAVPSLKSSHKTFYADPINGSMSGDGSAARPWSTLSDIVASGKLIATQQHSADYHKGTDTGLHPVNPAAPIQAGDLILLRSGDHGSVTIENMYNSDFITVAAAPGATPIIDKMAVASSAKWMFQNLTFQGIASASSAALVSTGVSDWQGPANDIVFDSDTFQTAASTIGWTDNDWLNKPYGNAVRINAACTSVTSSHFQNIFNGIGITAEKILIQGNTIEKFSNDGIDIVSSNITLKGNTIKNGMNNRSSSYHADGIQGWSSIVNGAPITNYNVMIDGNTIIKTGDPSISYLQGISIFDGKWSKLTIQNNVVAVNTFNSVVVFGAQSANIVNNTVISGDSSQSSWLKVAEVANDSTVIKANPTNYPTWFKPVSGNEASSVIVRNNIATQFDVSGGVVFDHNIAAESIITHPNGAVTKISSGNTGILNMVRPEVLNGFVGLNIAAGTIDVRLRSTSVAIGTGTTAGAPALDIQGRSRLAPVDIGAYNH